MVFSDTLDWNIYLSCEKLFVRYLVQLCQCQTRERPVSTFSQLCECPTINKIFSYCWTKLSPFICNNNNILLMLLGTGRQWWAPPMLSRSQKVINLCRWKARLSSCNTYTGRWEKDIWWFANTWISFWIFEYLPIFFRLIPGLRGSKPLGMWAGLRPATQHADYQISFRWGYSSCLESLYIESMWGAECIRWSIRSCGGAQTLPPSSSSATHMLLSL